MKYKKYADFQYTEGEMRGRLLKASPRLIAKRVDIFVTHAQTRGLGDMDDLPHRGFECFNIVLEKFKPDYMIHGHVHMNYGRKVKRVQEHGDTKIISAFEKYTFEYEPKKRK